METTHLCPPKGSGVTPCCEKTPFQLPRTDRLTEDLSLVTCSGVKLELEVKPCWAPGCDHLTLGGPVYGLFNDGKPIYTCDLHFLLLRKRSDLQHRRLVREARRQRNK